jgi:2'-5' RNA ligase
MRLFIAVTVNDEIKRRIVELQETIKARSLKGRFTKPEHLHLTLVFLGETPGERIAEISGIMRKAALPPFELPLSTAGFFKRAGKELWWLGAGLPPSAGADEVPHGLDKLCRLRQNLAEGLLAAGFSIDTHPFNAHITLGREIRSTASPFTVEAIVIPVNRISLMKSERQGRSLVYTELFWAKLDPLKKACLRSPPAPSPMHSIPNNRSNK